MTLPRDRAFGRVFTLVMCLLSTFGCTQSGSNSQSIMITLAEQAKLSEGSSCVVNLNDSRVVCSDLQSAIDWTVEEASVLLSAEGSSQGNFVEIRLTDGIHAITEQSDLQNMSLHLIGLSDNVTIQCNYSADLRLSNSREIHTWYFDHSNSVVFKSIHFKGCVYPFRLDTVRNVDISNCTFRYFTQAVLDVYNCQNVTITDVIVQNNSGTGRLIESFRGNSGGIAIGYNTLPGDYFNPTVQISNSVFQNNRANGFRTPNRAVAANVYLGRGGGLGVFLNESLHNLTLTISDCLFENNTVRLFGGGLFILTQSHPNNQLNMLIERSIFRHNNASYGGAGVQLSYLNSGSNSNPHTVVFRRCDFVNNRGSAGSGIYIFVGDDGNLAKLEHCNFTGNTGFGRQLDFGAAVALSYLTVFRQRVISPRHEISDCFFADNRGPNGVVSVGYAPAAFRGLTHFSNNQGASLRIIGSVVDFEGETIFTENQVVEFGALQLLSFAQVRFKSGSKMKFIRNIGKLGASIVVDSPALLSSFSDLLFNPKCFVLYEDRAAPPSEWDNVNVTFVGNQAVVASSVYVSQTDPCSWFTDTPPYFNNTHIPDWPIWNYIDNRNNGHDDPLDQQFSFGTAALRLSTDVNTFSAWPGQRISMPLKGLDHFNHSTSVNARFFFSSHESSASSTVRFDPEIIVIAGQASEPGGQELLQRDFPLIYTVANTSILDTNGEPLGNISMEEPFNSYPVLSDSFVLSPLPCPAGYSLNPVSPNQRDLLQHCTCLESAEIITCEDDQDNVIIKNDLWAEYVPSKTPNLFIYSCPSGYCRCFQNTSLGSTLCASMYSHSSPDLQCKCNREGILCGSCRNNSGVSVLLNECIACSNAFGALVGVLVVLDVIALVVVTLLDKPFPMWAYSFIFYIQMAPYASEAFIPGFEAIGRYLYFISSGTSFYFIYDFCLHSKLSPLVSYFLRYLPLFAALGVFPIIWIIRKRAKHATKKWKSLRKHGYWWMIVLLYSHVLHTSMSILNCPMIPDSNGNKAPRWYVDGDIQCFTGGHIPLALLAILVLALCVFLIPTLIVLAIKPHVIRYWIDPVTAGFKDEVKWWSGMELGRRLLFLLFIISFPKNTVYGMLVLVISMIIYTYILPYKSKVANTLEIVVHLNFLTLLVLETTPLFQDTLFIFPALSEQDLERSSRECVDSPKNTSLLSWLLLPFYYLPVLGLIVTASIYSMQFLMGKAKKHKATSIAEEDPYIKRATNITSQVIEIDYSKEEGEVELHAYDTPPGTGQDSEPQTLRLNTT